MHSGGEQSGEYAHLPDELLESVTGAIPLTVNHAESIRSIDPKTLTQAREELDAQNLIQRADSGNSTNSVIAVDGGSAIQRLEDIDLALVQAAGVEGLGNESDVSWGEDRNQYLSWQSPLAHNIANRTLVNGIMTLMEMDVLMGSHHEIKIIDGSHLSFIISLNKLLSAGDSGADQSYIRALYSYFLDTYGGDINQIHRTLSNIITNDTIISSTKYSSSSITIDTHLSHLGIQIGDKAFFRHILNEDEYLTPQQIGLHTSDNEAWGTTHINLNLNLPNVDTDEFNWLINEALAPLKVRGYGGSLKDSNIFYTYYRPFKEGPVYRLEIKKSLAENKQRLHKTLESIKNQVVYPYILEPYPQHLADAIAKSVSVGLGAIREAVVLSDDHNDDAESKIQILRNYRT